MMGQEVIRTLVQETGVAMAKVTPPVVGSVWTMDQYVILATLIYLMLQIGLLLPKYFKAFRKWRKS